MSTGLLCSGAEDDHQVGQGSVKVSLEGECSANFVLRKLHVVTENSITIETPNLGYEL